MTGEPSVTSLKHYASAFAVSVFCHAILVLGILPRVFLADRVVPPPITITIRDAGTSGGDGGGLSNESTGGGQPVPATASEARARDARTEHVTIAAAVGDENRHEVAPPRTHAPTSSSDAGAEARRHSPTTSRSHPSIRAPRADAVDRDDRAAALDLAQTAAAADAVAPRAVAGDHDGDGAAVGDRGSVGHDAMTGAAAPGDGAAGSGGGNRGGDGGGGGDLRASCASCPSPEYPARARRQGWQGTVDVALRVGSDGGVEQAQVGRSSGYAVLDAAAVAVARQSRFHGADRGGLRGSLRYRFVLEEKRAGSF